MGSLAAQVAELRDTMSRDRYAHAKLVEGAVSKLNAHECVEPEPSAAALAEHGRRLEALESRAHHRCLTVEEVRSMIGVSHQAKPVADLVDRAVA